MQQLKDDDIKPLCMNLGRFKRLKKIDLVRGYVMKEMEGRFDMMDTCVDLNVTVFRVLVARVTACDSEV